GGAAACALARDLAERVRPPVALRPVRPGQKKGEKTGREFFAIKQTVKYPHASFSRSTGGHVVEVTPCPKCGREGSASDAFCPHCGAAKGRPDVKAALEQSGTLLKQAETRQDPDWAVTVKLLALPACFIGSAALAIWGVHAYDGPLPDSAWG